jgi:PAS domain S-box-containing protein
MVYLKSHIIINFRNFLILISFVFVFETGFSQRYFIKTYTSKDGLPTRNVNDACQDKNGIMWFATNFGVSKYDGFSFTNYDNSCGLPDQHYKRILIDEKGVIWVMPDNPVDTIVFFINNRWEKIRPPATIVQSHLLNSFDIVYKNGAAVLCMGNYDGFYIYENKAWTHHKISDDPRMNNVYCVISRKQVFYLSTKIGLCLFENGKLDWSLNTLIKPYGTEVVSISFENKNLANEKLWVLNEKWIGFIQRNRFTLVSNKFELQHPLVFYNTFMEADKKGNVFFGNNWSKYLIPDSSDIPVPLMISNGFTSDGANSVFIDREQNIWFPDTRGISKFNNFKIKSYLEKNGMRENEVSAVCEMNDGKIVLGHNKGLSIFNNNTFKTIDFPESEQKNMRVLDMIKDNSGSIWFASVGLGMGKLQANGNIKWYNLNRNAITSAVLQDISGKIWAGIDGKLFFMQNDQLVEYTHNDQIKSTLRKIFPADDGGIFLAGSGGLWYVHNEIIKKIPSPADKKADNVYSYYKDKKKTEFVGTIHGLFVIENGRIIKFKKNGIEINSPVFLIFQDHKGIYWIGSDNGVYRWDGESKLAIFNSNNGLAGWETNRSAGISDSKGRIWVGTDRGLSCFEPGFDQNVVPTPVIHFLYAEDSRGIQHSLSKKSSINYTDNSVQFQFRAISFYNEDLIEYKYKLEGFDEEWQDINQPLLGKVRYIGLKPGKYVFCVKARNISGDWTKVERSYPIRITPPVYLTWWFLLLALIVIGAIIFGFIRINVQKLHNSKLEKEIVERKRIEQALTESRQKFQDLVELLPETIYEADFSGKLVYLNDTGLKLFGYQHEDVDSDMLIDQLVGSDSFEDIHLHMEAVFKYKKSDRAIMTGITKKGDTFPFSIHTVPIISDNRCIGTRGVIIDLTEQKRFEDKIQKNAEDLQALNKSKDKLFSIIAHDLRSPFTTFLGFTEVLDEEIETLPKDELKTIVTYMRNSANNLYQLLENLLEWSLLHREITRFKPESVLLLPLVKNCTNTITDTAKLKGINLIIEIPEELKVEADIHMLQTIIRNLLSNAVKFTPSDGSVHVYAFNMEEQFVTIAVKDTGIGIKAEQVQRIFHFDVNNKTKGTDGELSTGLGLILCKEFVEKHRGKIWVESLETKGSTFYFTIGSSKA